MSTSPGEHTSRPRGRLAPPLALARALALCVPGILWADAGAVDRISVVGLFPNMVVVEIDGKRRTLKAGSTSPEGVKLISANSQRAVLEVNGERATFGLGASIGSSFAAPRELSVRIWPSRNNMYEIGGLINGSNVDFMVDTGATLISMNSHDARRLGIDYLVEGEEGESSTASGIAKIYLLTLDKVRVGEIEMRAVRAAVHDGDFPDRILLGMSFLSRVDLRREGKMLELKKKF
ncbi:MAG: retropepsin-like aspartic protease family protein [Gammaproteobacteria bacterium]